MNDEGLCSSLQVNIKRHCAFPASLRAIKFVIRWPGIRAHAARFDLGYAGGSRSIVRGLCSWNRSTLLASATVTHGSGGKLSPNGTLEAYRNHRVPNRRSFSEVQPLSPNKNVLPYRASSGCQAVGGRTRILAKLPHFSAVVGVPP